MHTRLFEAVFVVFACLAHACLQNPVVLRIVVVYKHACVRQTTKTKTFVCALGITSKSISLKRSEIIETMGLS